MRRTSIIILFLFCVSTICSQSKRLAARYFKEYDYKKASDLYKQMYDKGDVSQLVLGKLGDCYYLNSNTEEAEKWYSILYDKYGKDIGDEYIFKYAQTLKANGNYEMSDSLLLTLVEEGDDRAEKLQEVPDYVSVYGENKDEEINIHNLSTNTKYSDFGGFVSKDHFYFTSASPVPNVKKRKVRLYKWNNQPFLNICKAKLNKTGDVLELTDKKYLQKPIKTHFHEATIIFTRDGSTAYFTRDNYDGKVTGKSSSHNVHLKIYRATKIGGKWGNIKELPFNSDEYSTGHPALSPDEKTLYFASDRLGGYGATDIYKVSIDGDFYGAPINLGKTINTKGREIFPFVSEDNTLYFSSNGHLGLGLLDVFESKISGNSYTIPKNIQAPFNSKFDDFGFWVNKKKTEGFFSSNRKGGKGDDDIYSFTIKDKEEIKEKKCMLIISGIVVDSNTKDPVSNSGVKLVDEKGKVLREVGTDEEGYYKMVTTCLEGGKVFASKDDYKSSEIRPLGSKFTKEENFKSINLSIQNLIVSDQIVLKPIYFDLNKSNIREDAAYELEYLISVMKNHPEMKIRIESHTDSRGSKSYNKALSQRRANATKAYIVSRGILSSRITEAVGYGEMEGEDCESGCNEDEYQKNRNSYFYIVE